MTAWAASGKFPNAAFLCICVDPEAFLTAKEFAQLYFGRAPKTLVNGFIDSQSDFPKFQAQLGCQGFIIYDSQQKLVTTKTLSFDEYRNRAFLDVEGRLSPLLQEAPPQNLAAQVKPSQEGFDAERCLRKVVPVGHNAMDAQHDSCVNSLSDLAKHLTVKQLLVVHQELRAHFDEEEKLLRKYGFGNAGPEGGSDSDLANDFSAFGSHAKDHRRILAVAEDALSKLHNVCGQSDAYGGTVPKAVAQELCQAFVDHASTFDSLYEGKLFDQAMMEKVVGWYEFSWQCGSFQVCFRPNGTFFCPEYRAPATWIMVENAVKIDWGRFGKYEMEFNPADMSMIGNEVPKDNTNGRNWRRAKFIHNISDAESIVLGDGEGTEWEFEWKEGKFLVMFQADGYNSFVCNDFPAQAHWNLEGNEVTIHWGGCGNYRLSLDLESKVMEGGKLGVDPAEDTWWRKAYFVRSLPAERCDRP